MNESMPGRPRNMSFRDTRFYDPYTDEGSCLDADSIAVPRIHECGMIVANRSWDYRRVCSPFWRAYFNLEPGAAIKVNGSLCRLRPGHLVIIPQEVSYDCICTREARHFWVHFSLDVKTPPTAHFDLKLDPIAKMIWYRLALETQKKSALRILRYMCLAALVDTLGRLDMAEMPGAGTPFHDLLRWFDAHMANPPLLDVMAARVGLGRRTFIRWFRVQTGSTPALYMKRRRIREACRLLRFGTASVEQIAEMTGFANRHHFTRIFSAETGCGPSAFRKGHM